MTNVFKNLNARFLLVVLLAVAGCVVVPIGVIVALNGLGAEIPITIKTWVCVAGLLLIVTGISSA